MTALPKSVPRQKTLDRQHKTANEATHCLSYITSDHRKRKSAVFVSQHLKRTSNSISECLPQPPAASSGEAPGASTAGTVHTARDVETFIITCVLL